MYFIKYIFVSGSKTNPSTPSVIIKSIHNLTTPNYKFKERNTSQIQDTNEINILRNLQNQIKTIRQCILIIIIVFIVLTVSYLGKCLYRHWRFRTFPEGNTNTTGNLTINDNNHIESFYHQVLDTEYVEPQRKLSASIDDVSVDNNISSDISVEPLNEDRALNGLNLSRNKITADRSDTEERGNEDIYITPCV